MLASLTRFCIAAALASLAYGLGAIVLVEAARALSPEEPSPLVKTAANLVALLLAACVDYVATHDWVFASRIPHVRAVPRFLAVALGCLVVHELAFYALLASTPLPYPVALAITLALTGLLAFAILRRFVFTRG